LLRRPAAETRARAVATLGRIAYQPKPYEGHWWATQPVKSPPPLSAIAWRGTAQIVEALIAALTDTDTGVRVAAAGAFTNFILGAAGNDQAIPSKALAVLRARLDAETDPLVRRELIESLGVQKDPQAMSSFTKIILDRSANTDLRRTALNAISKSGGDAARKTVAELIRTDLPNEIALDVIRAVGRLKVADAADLLKGRLHATDPELRLACIQSLAALGTKGNATGALIDVLGDDDIKVRQAAIEALAAIRDKTALPALIAAAENNKLKKQSIVAIANMADERAIPVLINAIGDNDGTVRREALKALKSMKEKSWPLVEERLVAGLIPAEFESEIATLPYRVAGLPNGR
jgi:HEAT repeat protein